MLCLRREFLRDSQELKDVFKSLKDDYELQIKTLKENNKLLSNALDALTSRIDIIENSR